MRYVFDGRERDFGRRRNRQRRRKRQPSCSDDVRSEKRHRRVRYEQSRKDRRRRDLPRAQYGGSRQRAALRHTHALQNDGNLRRLQKHRQYLLVHRAYALVQTRGKN